jgi:F-type H+-transporting ATPase subunit b
MEESLFSLTNPEFWVLVALVTFFGLLVVMKVIPGTLFAALDAHAAKIQSELDEAKRLREEAAALLADANAQRDAVEKQATEILAAAKADAKRLAAEAKVKLDEQIVRRAEMAERKIAIAEAAAAAEVKAAAADLAAGLAEQVLTARIATAKSDPLVDKAIGLVGTKLQ